MNADGDGCGSESALAQLLAARGAQVKVVNPTPWPSSFDFLLHDSFREHSAKGPAAASQTVAVVIPMPPAWICIRASCASRICRSSSLERAEDSRWAGTSCTPKTRR